MQFKKILIISLVILFGVLFIINLVSKKKEYFNEGSETVTYTPADLPVGNYTFMIDNTEIGIESKSDNTLVIIEESGNKRTKTGNGSNGAYSINSNQYVFIQKDNSTGPKYYIDGIENSTINKFDSSERHELTIAPDTNTAQPTTTTTSQPTTTTTSQPTTTTTTSSGTDLTLTIASPPNETYYVFSHNDKQYSIVKNIPRETK